MSRKGAGPTAPPERPSHLRVSLRDVQQLLAIQDASYAVASSSLLESWPKAHAMDRGSLGSFLEAMSYCVLATTRPDRRPQASPVAFLTYRGAFWFASVPGARIRNLRAVPFASLVVLDGQASRHRALVAEGQVVLHPLTEAFARRWQARHGNRASWAALVIELQPERLFSFVA